MLEEIQIKENRIKILEKTIEQGTATPEEKKTHEELSGEAKKQRKNDTNRNTETKTVFFY